MADRPKGGKLINRGLMHAAARLHYIDGLSQVEVARRMEVSKATVSRLLSLARREGIVRIEVGDLEEIDDLGTRLAEALGLRAARVVEAGRAGTLGAQVGALIVNAALEPGSVVAVGWGRTVQGVISAGLPKCPEIVVVPAMGGMSETEEHFQINEFARRTADAMGGEARLLYAPSMVSPAVARLLEQDPGIAALIALWERVDVAILGIGRYEAGIAGIDPGFADGHADAAVGDILRHYFDAAGNEVGWPDEGNLVAMRRDQLSRVPLSIGVAVGDEKTAAILGAVRSGMINALVTDAHVAVRLLDAAG